MFYAVQYSLYFIVCECILHFSVVGCNALLRKYFITDENSANNETLESQGMTSVTYDVCKDLMRS